MSGLDLYALLGVRSNASAAELLAAYEQLMAEPRNVAGRDLIRDAFAVLADPRLRVEYDAGRVVGVGAGVYYQRDRARPHARPTIQRLPAPPRPAGKLEERWEARWASRQEELQEVLQESPMHITYTSVMRPFFWWLLGVICGSFGMLILFGILEGR